MNTSKEWVSVCVLVIGLLAGAASAVNIETVTVGNPGNVGEWAGANGGSYGVDRICGAVSYTYSIGKYEITAGQYTECLNAVAKTDTYGLYNTNMWTNTYGCKIQRSGISGSYTYSVASDWANRPVNYVSWGDATRFANWMHNGQPTGLQNASTTEDGSYYLNGATDSTALLAVTRRTNATWVIPSEDEWYKAAYYKGGSTNAGYWDYPTNSDVAPSNVVGEPIDPGNNATYDNNGYTIDGPYYRTEVGFHENSESPYGTFDQGGNVWEWNDTLNGVYRGIRGSSFCYQDIDMRAASRSNYYPSGSLCDIGFRVAYVPDPATIVMLALGGVAIIRRRKA